jgi:hypothetical protein
MESTAAQSSESLPYVLPAVPIVDTSSKIRHLVYKMSSEQEEQVGVVIQNNKHIPRVIIFLNIVVSPIIGILMAIRGNYDGKLSVFGIVLRMIYFVLFLIAIYFDHRFERIERWARILPKLFGVFLLGFQLVGVIPRYDCKQDSWRTCI